jgi:vitamin-K-epoxide reductase (warfarin-sensitive)
VRYLILLLALAGVIVSGMALRVHYVDEDEPCHLNDKWDCGVVNHSPYSVIGQVPVASIGIAGYLLIGILSLMRRRGMLLGAVTGGFAFALYLTHIEAHVLGVWCLYCVISQGIIAVLLLLAIAWVLWGMKRRAASSTQSV